MSVQKINVNSALADLGMIINAQIKSPQRSLMTKIHLIHYGHNATDFPLFLSK